MTDDRIIKTYVWHAGICYFVSTIERDSSAMLGPERYNETIVWAYDWPSAKRGAMLWQGDASVGSIRTHQKTVETLFKSGIELLTKEDET